MPDPTPLFREIAGRMGIAWEPPTIRQRVWSWIRRRWPGQGGVP